MNLSTRTSMAGAAALLAVLVTTAACGNESVVTDPGSQAGTASVRHAATGGDRDRASSGHISISADTAERQALALKERQDRASTLRWARATKLENQLKYAGHPGRP
jgi:hypothetical protein